MRYGDMRRYADSLGVTVCSEHLSSGRQGLYSAKLDMIVIDRAITYTAKRCTLMHELVHWRHGDRICDSAIGARIENRARRETAMLLVAPADYALAEQVYEGDVFRIAAELDVTRQVVEDYQSMVLSRLRETREAI
jgi:Zn-dependent peptidase ImmA (M78 family)